MRPGGRASGLDFDKTGRHIAWLFALIGLVFAVAAAWTTASALGMDREGEAAEGRIVALHAETRRMEPGMTGYTRGATYTVTTPEIEFVTREGRRVHVRGGPGGEDWDVGDTLDLFYLPRDPTVVEFEAGDTWWMVGFFALFAVAFLLPLLFMVVLPALRGRPPRRRR